jgi:adenylate kinase family enzyme
MEGRPGAPPSPIPTATGRGVSPAWTGTSPTRSPAMTNCPPTDREWNVYKVGVAPAPEVVIHHCDPREPCPAPNVVYVLGGPGAGKGTMCELAEIQLGWTHLSTGDLLRAEQETGGPTTGVIREYIAAGKLVPNEIVVRLLRDAMERTTRTTGKRNFLLDGFPPIALQPGCVVRSVRQGGGASHHAVFRMSLRGTRTAHHGRARYSGRADDNVEAMRARFDTFKAETLPTVELFRSKGKCVEIDTSQDREAVYAPRSRSARRVHRAASDGSAAHREGRDPPRPEALPEGRLSRCRELTTATDDASSSAGSHRVGDRLPVRRPAQGVQRTRPLGAPATCGNARAGRS